MSLSVNEVYFIVIVSVILIVLILNMYNTVKIVSLNKKYNRFIKSFGNSNIEESLEKFMSRVEEVYNKGLELENHCNQIDRNLIRCFQKVGVVRYNAFNDVGSDLSFAIALLDANDDGFVINGIYARDSSATYAKPITGGNSKHTLSAEEMQALDLARKSNRKDNKETGQKLF